MNTMKEIARFGAMVLVALIGAGVTINAVKSEEAFKSELDALRRALSKYQDVYTAVREGYFSTVGCVHYSGEKMEGHVDYAKGAMGIHFINTSLIGPNPDPMRPSILIYEPRDRQLHLVAVEWFVPLAPGLKRPTLFDQSFLGPMEGHVPILPKEFTHYDLHAWLFKENPYGMFAPTNPNVTCEGYDFSLLEHPTKLVPQP